jgi:hypothetical protein
MEFVSKLEEIMKAEELTFENTDVIITSPP